MFFAWLLVKIIAPFVHIRKTKEGCAFEWETNTIYYNKAQDPFDVGFIRHLKEKHYFENPEQYAIPLWSLLHELGHYFYPDEEEDLVSKTICALLPYELAVESKTLQDMYYDSPDEYAATEWAIDWIVTHPKLASLFSALL